MNLRRQFLKCLPLGLAVSAYPVLSAAAVVVSKPNEVPMRGTTETGYDWWTLKIQPVVPTNPSDPCQFVSSVMRQRPDGAYELLFERCK